MSQHGSAVCYVFETRVRCLGAHGPCDVNPIHVDFISVPSAYKRTKKTLNWVAKNRRVLRDRRFKTEELSTEILFKEDYHNFILSLF